MFLNKNSKITAATKYADSRALRRAVGNLRRDLEKSCLDACRAGAEIRLCDGRQEPEGYALRCVEGRLEIQAADEPGICLWHICSQQGNSGNSGVLVLERPADHQKRIL